MINFKEFLLEKQLNEVLLTFGNQKDINFNQIVIMAGGAGSGKGFVKSKLLGLDGIVFDVDRLKELALKSTHLKAKIKDEFGIELDDLNLRQPSNVSKLHMILKQINISDRKTETLIQSIVSANDDRKPNLIFDITMKSTSALIEIQEFAKQAGYKKENIHIVWVLNDMETAQAQNAKRDRVVDDEILKNTHEHVSFQMSKILSGKLDIRKYMDGLFYIVFNNRKFGSYISKKTQKGALGKGKSGYVEKQDYVKIKDRNKPLQKVSTETMDKIKQLVPDESLWLNV